MSLLLPAFFAAAALIGLPIALHLLRRRPRDRVPFPTLRFLGPHALRDTRRQQIMRWLTLLARCALILLVALAFSRPYWPQANDRNSRAVIVAVDNSFSMQTTGRRKNVDQWLDQQLASLGPGDRLGVLQLQPTPTWLAPLSENIAAGRAALQTRDDGYESSHYAAGLALAAAVLDETPAGQRQILIAGDEQRVAWADVDFLHALPAGVELIPAPTAPLPGTQAAISNLHASREPGGKLLLAATVRLYLPAKLSRTVTFYVGERVLGTLPVDLTAGVSQVVQVEYPAPPTTGDLALRATIDNDDLPADNIAYTVLPPDNARKVLLAAPTAGEVDFLAAALAAVHGGDLPTLAVSPLPMTAWPVGAVAVLRGAAPFLGSRAEALDKFLEAGGAAWVLCDGSPEQIAWLGQHGVKVTPAQPATDGQALHLRDFDVDHPLFAPFAGHSLAPLLDAEFQVGWSLANEEADPLARWPDHTMAVAEVHAGLGRLLITGFDDRRATANWPLQTAFLPFAHHAIVWLGDSAPSLSQSGRVGQRISLPGPGVWQSFNSPRVTAAQNAAGDIRAAAPGIYEYEAAGLTRLFAINVDLEESDLSPWPTDTDFAKLVSTEPRSPTTTTDAARPLAALSLDHNTQIWWWLLATAVILLGFELGIANRTTP